MFKCKNCGYESEILSEKPLKGKCIRCGDDVYEVKVEVKPVPVPVPVPKLVVIEPIKAEPKPMDLNRDGTVDKQDVKIAAKLMGQQKKGKRR